MAIVRNIKNNHLYRYHGNDIYTNLHSGIKGEIKPERAKMLFKINLELTQLIAENPLIEEMITKLKLIADKP